MATTDNDPPCQSCTADPNYAIICSFLEKFSVKCGISHFNFLELQEMLENTVEVRQPLVDLHIKLLRKARKNCSADKWERVVTKFCHSYSKQDGWELERFGYKNSRIEVKLRLLKHLLEAQFDSNSKFKSEVNKLSASELRIEPLGRDQNGQTYWCQFDPSCNIRIYKEDPDDEESWDLIAKDRVGLVSLIDELSSGEGQKELNSILNEDSNSQEIDKPIVDTGQVSPGTSPPQLATDESLSQEVKQYSDSTNGSTEIVASSIKEPLANCDSDSNSRHPGQETDATNQGVSENTDKVMDHKPEQVDKEKVTDELDKSADSILQKADKTESNKVPNQDNKVINSEVDKPIVPIKDKVSLPDIEITKAKETVDKIPERDKGNVKEAAPLPAIPAVAEKSSKPEACHEGVINSVPVNIPVPDNSKPNVKLKSDEHLVNRIENVIKNQPIKKVADEVGEDLTVKSAKKMNEAVVCDIRKGISKNVTLTVVSKEENKINQPVSDQNPASCEDDVPEKVNRIPTIVESVKSVGGISRMGFSKKMKGPPGSKLDEIFKFKRVHDPTTPTNLPPQSQPIPAYIGPGVKDSVLAHIKDGFGTNDEKREVSISRVIPEKYPPERSTLRLEERLGEISQRLGMRQVEIKPIKSHHVDSMQAEDLTKPKVKEPEEKTEPESKKLKLSKETEFSEAVEEPLMLVRGEGSGADCNTGNLVSHLDFFQNSETNNIDEPEFGETIEEPVMFFFGEGSGAECDTGNPELEKNSQNSDEKAHETDDNNSGEVEADSQDKKVHKLWSIDAICNKEREQNCENSKDKPLEFDSTCKKDADLVEKPCSTTRQEELSNNNSLNKTNCDKSGDCSKNFQDAVIESLPSSKPVEEPAKNCKSENYNKTEDSNKIRKDDNIKEEFNKTKVGEPEKTPDINKKQNKDKLHNNDEVAGLKVKLAASEVKDEQTALEVTEKQAASQVTEEKSASRPAEIKAVSKAKEEPASSEAIEEQTAPEVAEEQTAPEVAEEQAASVVTKEQSTSRDTKGKSSYNTEGKASEVTAEKTASGVKKEQFSSEVAQEKAPLEVTNEKSSSEIKEEQAALRFKKEPAALGVKEEQTTSRPKKEQAASGAKVEQSSSSAKEGQAASTFKKEQSTSSVKEEHVALKVKEERTTSRLKKDQVASGVTEGQAAPRLKKDQVASGVREEPTALRLKKDQAASGVKEELTSSGVEEEQAALNLKKEQSGLDVTEGQAVSDVKEKLTDSGVEEELTGSGVKEVQAALNFKKDQVASGVTEGQAAPRLKKDKVASGVKEELTGSGVKEELTGSGIKEELTGSGVKEEQAALNLKKDQATLRVNEEQPTSDVKDKGKLVDSGIKENQINEEVEDEVLKEIKYEANDSKNNIENEESKLKEISDIRNEEHLEHEKNKKIKEKDHISEKESADLKLNEDDSKNEDCLKDNEIDNSRRNTKTGKSSKVSRSRRSSKAGKEDTKDETVESAVEEIVETRRPRRSAALIATQLSENIIKARSKKQPQQKIKITKDEPEIKKTEDKGNKKQPAPKGVNKGKKAPAKRGGKSSIAQEDASDKEEDKPDEALVKEEPKTGLGLNSFSFDVDDSGNLPMPVIPSSRKRRMDKGKSDVEEDNENDDEEEPLSVKKQRTKGGRFTRPKRGKRSRTSPKKKVKKQEPQSEKEDEGDDEEKQTTPKKVKEEIPKAEEKPKPKKPVIKSKTLLGLTERDLMGVEPVNTGELSASGRSVRTSRRIAQIKIKEQEEERKMHEQTMKEINNAREREKQIKKNKDKELFLKEINRIRGPQLKINKRRNTVKLSDTNGQVARNVSKNKEKEKKKEHRKEKEDSIKINETKDKPFKVSLKENKDEKKKTPKKNISAKTSDGDFTPYDQDSNDTIRKKKGRPRKKKEKFKYDHNNPWKSSSGSGTSDEDDDLEHFDMEEEEEEEDPRTKALVSDHEFSPESDLEAESEGGVPVRHARTALKGVAEDKKEEEDDTACQKCNKSDHPEWILLCDKCDKGWHGSCLRPALMIVPEGDWFCPPCQHLQLVEKLKETLRIFEKDSKRRENDELRRKRLAYVGISLSNVLPPPGTKVKLDESSSSSSVSSRSDDSGSSSESSSYDDEPVYQLRVRRQTNQSYRFNDYDQLINSAIQDEMEAVAGAGNQGRGKDIENIVEAERQETNGLDETAKEVVMEDKGDEGWKPPVVPRRGSAGAFSGGRKKPRKLTNIDASSAEDDQDSDEDFKGSSSSYEEEESNSDYSSGSDVRGSRRKSQPVRRSTRARTSRIDREFINDDSEDSDAPKKKKSRKVWSESESSESDETWGRRKKKPSVKVNSRNKKKKKSRYSESESDSPPPRKQKSKKSKKKSSKSSVNCGPVPLSHSSSKSLPFSYICTDLDPSAQVKYGLSEDEEYGRRTRGKKINYQESESDDNTPQVVKARRVIESDEEDDYNPEQTDKKKSILSDSEDEDESDEEDYEDDEEKEDKNDDHEEEANSSPTETKEEDEDKKDKDKETDKDEEEEEKKESSESEPELEDKETKPEVVAAVTTVKKPSPPPIVVPQPKPVHTEIIRELSNIHEEKKTSDNEMFIGDVEEEDEELEEELEEEEDELDEELEEKRLSVKLKIPSPISSLENKPEISLTIKPVESLKSVKDKIVEEELNDELISVPGPIAKVVPASEIKDSVKEVEKLEEKEEKKPDPPKVNTIRIVPQHKLMANPPPQLEVKSMMMRPRVPGPHNIGGFPGMRYPPRPHMMRAPPQYPSQYPSQYLPYYSHHYPEEYPSGYGPPPGVHSQVSSQQVPPSAPYNHPEEGGEFGGLVSYFSSQHEDNLDS